MAMLKSIKTETFYTQEGVNRFLDYLKSIDKKFNVEYEYDYNCDLYVFVVDYEV